MSELQFAQTVTAEREELQNRFVDWIYATYDVIWDDMLVDLMQDGDVQLAFLKDMGLDEETVL